jgi:hypothetical protein
VGRPPSLPQADRRTPPQPHLRHHRGGPASWPAGPGRCSTAATATSCETSTAAPSTLTKPRPSAPPWPSPKTSAGAAVPTSNGDGSAPADSKATSSSPAGPGGSVGVPRLSGRAGSPLAGDVRGPHRSTGRPARRELCEEPQLTPGNTTALGSGQRWLPRAHRQCPRHLLTTVRKSGQPSIVDGMGRTSSAASATTRGSSWRACRSKAAEPL